MNSQTILGGWPMGILFVETLAATTILMLAVLAFRAPVARIFGARIAYLLWLAPALRMILPPLPAEWFPVAAMAVSTTTVFPGATVMMTDVSSPAPIIAAASQGSAAWPIIPLMIWLGGAALFFGWHCLAYRRFKSSIMASADYLDCDAKVPVAKSAAVSSPIALGIFGRAVIVPLDFSHRYDATEQRLALAHELAHHSRGDLTVNLAALAMLALHWFNPVAHFAHRAFRLDQEAACDAIVLAGATSSERHAYGTALFKSATGAMPLAVCAMGTATQLKSRLRRIAAGLPSGFATRVGLGVAGVLVVAGLGVTASTAIADAVDHPVARHGTVIKGEKVVWQDSQQESASTAPHAPLAPLAPEVTEPSPPPVEPRAPVPPAPPVPYDQADAARATAEAAADQAEAEAERASQAAEAARERAEAARERAADAAERARDAAENAAEAQGGTDISATCKSAHSRQVVARSDAGNSVTVVACDKAITAFTNARTREALKSARAQIAAMTDLTAGQRTRALVELDKAVNQMVSRGMMLQ